MGAEHKCLGCGYEWTSRKPNPIECPECKARLGRQKKKVNSEGEVNESD